MLARRLSPNEFGLWCVLTGLPAFAAHMDMGMGNALRNRLAVFASAGGRDEENRVCFFSCFRAALSAAGVFILLMLLTNPLIPWAAILRAPSPVLNEAWSKACLTAAGALAVQVALGLGAFGFFAYQETHINGEFDALRAALTLSAVAAAVWLRGSFLVLILAYFSGASAAAFASFLYFLLRRGWRFSWPSLSATRRAVGELAASGLQFAVLQASTAVIVFTDVVIVGRVCGLGPAGEYALVQKLFFALITLQFLFLTPLWSSYTQAHAWNDHHWMRISLKRSLLMSFFTTVVAAFFLAVTGPSLIYEWTSKRITDIPLFWSMAGWTSVYGLSNCCSVYLNSIGNLRRQSVLAAAGAFLNVPLALALGKAYGPVGVCWAGILCMLPAAVNNPWQVRGELMSFAVAAP